MCVQSAGIEQQEVNLANTYRNFAALAQQERSGIDYDVLVQRARPEFALVAPHGGGIEGGTSELADAIAASDLSFYTFEGLKSSGNTDLHITSTRFDEPMCLTLLASSSVVVTVHGEHSTEDGEGVFLGGLDADLGTEIGEALRRQGFDVRKHSSRNLQGLEPNNLCNRGTTGAGVQLELSRAVRKTLFDSLTKTGHQRPTSRFDVFVAAVRRALDSML